MSHDQVNKWKQTEDALSEHLRTCKLCIFLSKRHLCLERRALEEKNIAAFKGK